MEIVQFKQQNNSILLKTERGFVFINLAKVKFIQSSTDFPYQQKKLLSKSFVTLGVFSTAMNVFKLLLISRYFESNAWVNYTIGFLVVQFFGVAFFIIGIRWLKQCQKHKKEFPHNYLSVKLVFEDASVKTFMVRETVNIPLMVSEFLKEKESC